MDRIAIDFISVFGMPPVDFVHLAADLGCRHIGLGLEPMPPNPHNYPAWSLREDKTLRRDVAVALHERDVCVSLAEGFLIFPHTDIRDSAADLDIFCELGAKRINTMSVDFDVARSHDQFAALVGMAEKAGVETVLEFMPILGIANLKGALAAIDHVGRPDFRLLIDVMHFVRGGGTAAELAALDPGLIGYAQLCDGPLGFSAESYGDEARCERMIPGTGEFPLAEIVAALPRDLILGLEVPMLSAAEAGEGPRERLRRAIAATRQLLADAGA